MTASISAIVTTYNNAPYLPEALDSILAQTLSPSEIIVIDDASTDETPAILARYAAQDARFRIERFAANSGVVTARNRGIALASGDFIAFLDADDRWTPDKLALQHAEFAADPSLDAVFGMARQFITPDMDAEQAARISIPNPTAPAYVVGGALFRRELFETIGVFEGDDRQHYSFMAWYMTARERCMRERMILPVILERRIHMTNISRSLQPQYYLRGAKEVLERTRKLDALPPVLRTIFDTQTVHKPDGDPLPLAAHIDETSCYVLQHFVKRAHPSRIVEVGCAYGISSLAIAAAAGSCVKLQHHIFDPYQYSIWHGIGVENLRRAGFDGRFTLYSEPSEYGLPRLAVSGCECEFALIDGYHTFDQTLIDFYYINRMLTVGGIVVIDDIDLPPVQKVVRYVSQYPAYRRIDIPATLTVGGITIPVSNTTRLAAFLKVAPDVREWDWYADF
jgi:predicted O-methyltransferase YrrM